MQSLFCTSQRISSSYVLMYRFLHYHDPPYRYTASNPLFAHRVIHMNAESPLVLYQLPFAFKSWSVHTVNEVKNTFREALAEIRMRILIASNKLPCHTKLISIDTRWGENFGTPKVRTCSFWNSGTFHPRNSLISARSKEFTHCSSCWFLDLRFLLS